MAEWKGQLERGELLPLALRVDEEFLIAFGVNESAVKVVFRSRIQDPGKSVDREQ